MVALPQEKGNSKEEGTESAKEKVMWDGDIKVKKKRSKRKKRGK